VKTIPYGYQSIDHQEINEVIKVLKSDWLSQGPQIQKFEKAIARYCGAKYAVAVSSGTAALHLACKVAGLKLGNEAITTPMTFLATANAILMNGAKPVFVDIQPDTVNIDPNRIQPLIKRKTKVILPVHFAGLPAEMDRIQKIAKKHRLTVIEDACHALGSEFKGHRIGSCRFSDMTCFSFHPVKHITTGEGGCITTNSKKFYEALLALRNHGVYKPEKLKQKHGGWFNEMRDLGFNYRMSDIQAALGIAQLKKLPLFLERRRRIASRYREAFKNLRGIGLTHPGKNANHSYHLFVIRVKEREIGKSRREVFDALSQKGLGLQVHYIPVPKQPFYRKMGYRWQVYREAAAYYEEALSLPIFPKMTDDDIRYVIQNVKDIFHQRFS